MPNNLEKEINYIVAYLKSHKIEDMNTYTLFRFLDFLKENEEAYIKYSGKTNISNKMTSLWNILSIALSYCILLKSNLIISLLVGAGLIYIPNITLSKFSVMEYNELVTRINDTINKRLAEEDKLTKKLI